MMNNITFAVLSRPHPLRGWGVLVITVFALLLTGSCNRVKPDGKWKDTPTAGLVPIACDQCYEPIIQEQIDVFEALYIQASIYPIYTDEADAIDLLLNDSVRLAVTSRKLTEEEKSFLLQSRNMIVRELKVAQDAIALIVHPSNPDSMMAMPTLKKILTGEITEWSQVNPKSKLGKIDVMFDHKNSSTVRFAMDSICGKQPLSSGLYAQGSNQQVLNMVAEHPNSLGIIGVNWVSNENDSTHLSFLHKVKVMWVSPYEVADISNSYKPYQAWIATKQYPLSRSVYFLLTDPKSGLSTGFASFVASDRGQRIILHSGILPEAPVNIKPVEVKNQGIR